MSEQHTGHRSRMRERYIQDGMDHFAPHEILQLLLFYSNARGNTNDTAHRLLETFGSLKAVFEASPKELMTVKGIGQNCAVLISMIVPMFRRYLNCQVESKQVTNRQSAETLCKSLLVGLRCERFYLISLDSRGYVLGTRLIAEGTLGQVKAYPRLIAETALQHNASSVILTHNHPGGTLQPSKQDKMETIRIMRMLSLLDITLLDHIIISGNNCYSMTLHGDIHANSTEGTDAQKK